MAAGDVGAPKRYYSATATESELTNSLPAQSQGASYSSMIVSTTSGFPGTTPYTLIIDPDTTKEEVVTVTAVSGTTLTVTRGENNTQAVAHSGAAVVRHGISAREFTELQTHISARGYDTDSAIMSDSHVHGIGLNDGVVVGTDALQTLTRKTLVSPTITGTPGLDTSIVFEGSTADAYETTLTVTDPTADRTITLPNATGTVVLRDTTDTLTNKTLTSPTISGSPVITGLSSAGMVSSSATPKDYVDNILGSSTSAAVSAASAAVSATAAATSATSAAASASAAATSATSASNSATAAATSATNAAASATAAATSATSAAASATAAATSATSAAASATTAANSVASIATYATNAATSATSAATSATSAAASASAAATSETNAAASATSAAASYDSFDDRYLGAKSSAPSVDNDGNALITGALYWNSTTSAMFSWSGSAWVQITTTSSYSAPTLGSQTIASGTTYTNIDGLTINSTTIPSSKTLVVTTDKLSVLAATTSAELAGVISDETGSGALVFADTPTLVTPVLGAATATSINGTTIPTSATLTKTSDNLSVFATTTSAQLAGIISDETGSGSLVFGQSPSLNSPTINGGTLTGSKLSAPSEIVYSTAAVLSGTYGYSIAAPDTTGSVLYFTANPTANWTINLRYNQYQSLAGTMAVGDSLTIKYLVTNGASAYYQSGFQIDGSAQTVKWSGGQAPVIGNASSVDAYEITVIKTAATPTWAVFAAGPIKYA